MKKFKKILLLLILIILSILAIYIGQGYKMYKNALDDKPLEEMVQEIRSQKSYTKISNIPDIYKDAVIAVEDHRYYDHKGIDIIAIGRALLNDIRARELIEGGSTITQQLAKNMYFTQDKTLTRKIAEVFMAKKIESNYNKEEILELYVNYIYYGSGYYDIKSASLGYFDKEPQDLTEGESIMLAGIPNAPSVYNPKVSPKLARERQKQVIDKMIKYGKLSEGKADEILSENL
jgi:monofunctional glycosyltransferase